MTAFALEPVAERRLIIEQVAARRGILPVIVEKDFWVCWILGQIYATPVMASSVVFKGGTSLSKVFGVIERFSEDADLAVTPASLGILDADLDADLDSATSGNQREKRMRPLAKACEACVTERFQPALEAAITGVLGTPSAETTWLKYELDPQTDTPNLWFRYPSVLPQPGGYIAKQVKLELGALTDQQPIGIHDIQPMLAEALGVVFTDFKIRVVALELERTFWEKATILHAEYHRPVDLPLRDRMSRHYSDMAALWRHPSRSKAMARLDLLQAVVKHKSRFFASSWASYATALPGSFHLVPPVFRHGELMRDLESMQYMFLAPQPTFSELLQQLAEAEQELNA